MIRRTLGSVKQSITSRKYGVRLVFHGPGSALLSVESRRFFSAHCVTVKSSGGFMPARTFATTAFSADIPALLIVRFTIPVNFKVAPRSDTLLVFLWVVAVFRQILHHRVNFLADDFRSFGR